MRASESRTRLRETTRVHTHADRRPRTPEPCSGRRFNEPVRRCTFAATCAGAPTEYLTELGTGHFTELGTAYMYDIQEFLKVRGWWNSNSHPAYTYRLFRYRCRRRTWRDLVVVALGWRDLGR